MMVMIFLMMDVITANINANYHARNVNLGNVIHVK